MPEFARNMAFVIGINNYGNGVPPLHTAVNDAKKLVEILREQHRYQVWVCLDQLATLKNLKDLFEKTLPQQVKPDDRLLFYFAGHGIALNSEDGPHGYLIPQDANLGDTKTYLPMTQVHECLSNLHCRHFLGILDCCFAGAFRWSSTRDLLSTPEVIHQERYDRFITDPAWQVITSAASDQKALDAFSLNIDRGEIGNHSPFAAALFEALAGGADAYPPATSGKPPGDGVITATELYLYLRDRVELATEKHRLRQTPGIWALNKHDKGEYIFLTPGHVLNLPPAPPLDESQNPYRGLQSFEEKHSDLFFGRTALIEKLHKFMTTNPLTVVLGASGSGKSSLVKAGLIPLLRKSTMEQWYILSTIRPGEFPLRALNIALKNAKLPEIEVPNASFGQAVKNLAESIKVWATNNPNSKLLLCIDQSEELITLCRDEKERKEFFRQLGQAIATYPQQLRVVITLRSDFEPQLRDSILQLLPNALELGNTAIKNNWKVARFIVPAMSRTELSQAIEKPAEARVMYFDPHSLVDQLIDEVADMPGALPLLSFALREMYLKYLRRQREASNNSITIDRALTQADYEELGGVIQSLTQRADQEYKALVELNPAYEQTVRHVMLRMVALGGGQIGRRQVPMSELEYPEAMQPQVTEVIKRFSDARLLVGGTDAEDKSYVEPAHDALVRGWQRLQNWVKEEKNLRLQRRLTPAAVEWKSKQQTEYLWQGDPYLDVLQKEVLNSPNNNWLNQVETEFVQRSLQRRRNNRRRLISSVTGVILVLSGFAIFAGYQWRTSEIQQINALREASSSQLLSHQELEAMITSLRTGEALKQSFWQAVFPDSKLGNQVKKTLQKVLYGVKENNRLQVGNGISAVAFSPDDQMIATLRSLSDGTVQLWKPDGSSILWPHNGRQVQLTSKTNAQKSVPVVASSADHQIVALDYMGSLLLFFNTKDGVYRIPISAVAFNSTKKIVALTARDRVILLSLAGDQPLISLSGRRGITSALAFSGDGKTLATANMEVNEKQEKIGTVQIWNVENGTLLKTLEGDMNGVQQAVAISSDGQMVAASGWYGATLWKSDGTWHKKLEGHYGAVNTINFSPDGKMIATGGVDKIVKLWKMDGTLDKNLVGHSDAVWEVNFNPDSQIIASASSDNTVKLWQPTTDGTFDGTLLNTLAGHEDVVRAVAFSHDGKMIASASDDGTVKLWQLGGSSLKALSHNEQVYAVAYSPNGKTIATTNGHGWLTLWNPDGTLQKTYKWHGGPITAVAFSPNGQMITTAAWDRGVQIHNSDGTRRERGSFLEGHVGELNHSEVKGLSFSPDSQMIATAGGDGKVQLFNSGDGKLLKTLDKQNSPVWGVSFSPNGQIIASANSDGTVKLWNSDGTLLKTLSGHKNAVTAVAFSPNSQILASASADGTVKLWKSDGTPLKTLSGHEKAVSAVAFSRDGMIATASYDGTVKLWTSDGTLRKKLSGHENAVVKVAFSPDGKTIASASSDQTVILWKWEENLDLDQLLRYACAWARDYLQNNPNVSESDRHLCDK
ncbi:hypothetical protein BZZ01_19670 [Nostocales cyanobacterium HT-58-2]|nr:hypothetical protein BZZ01_19670 [Nostocales cyanobacterium HT-58-2]